MEERGIATSQLAMQAREERRRLNVLTQVTLVIVLIGFAFVYQYHRLGVDWMAAAVAATIVLGLANLLWARRWAGSAVGGMLATCLLLQLVVLSNWCSGGFYDPNFGWLYVIPMLGALLVDARAGLLFTSVVFVITLLFWWAPEAGIEIPNYIPPELHAEQSLANRLSAVVGIGVLLAAISSQQSFSRGRLEHSNASLEREIDRREEIQARLVQTERAAGMGSLAAGMAHEINNPLTYVIGNLEMLEGEIRSSGENEARDLARDAQPMISEAIEGAYRVSRLVRDLESFAPSRDESAVSLDLSSLIEQAVRMLAAETKHRARLSLELEPGLRIEGSTGRFLQALVGLLHNAALAIEPGAVSQNQIRIQASRRGDRILLEISDTGCGMDASALEKIFEPFYTTRTVGAGIGMGLTVAANVVDSMGGSIVVESRPGEGSEVRVDLPLADVEDRDEAPSAG